MEEQQQPQTDPWTAFLNWLAQIITPDWSDWVAFIPIAVAVGVVLAIVMLALAWVRTADENRSRVAPRFAGHPPPGVHLPGPSRWPFVLPIAAMLIFFSLAVRPTDDQGDPTSAINWPVFLLGLVISLVGILGWLRDASREWRRTAALEALDATLHTALSSGGAAALVGPGHAGAALPGVTGHEAAIESVPEQPAPPPGVHLPGPSPWPFFAPVGLMVLFFGLVLSPALLVAGVVMSLIAVVGWYLDAGREYRQVEAGHAPEPRTRDPERAFPKALAWVFALIALLGVIATAAPSLVALANPSAAPEPSGPAGGGPGPGGGGGEIAIAAKNIAFDKDQLNVPADEPFTLRFDNQEAVPHNVAIYQDDSLGTELFLGEIFPGPDTRNYEVPAIPAGSYYFVCSVHVNMNGTVTAE
ncbi:MAG: cupredoxin domain-containing protein [Candidatus Limnocylindrales bacterium]